MSLFIFQKLLEMPPVLVVPLQLVLFDIMDSYLFNFLYIFLPLREAYSYLAIFDQDNSLFHYLTQNIIHILKLSFLLYHLVMRVTSPRRNQKHFTTSHFPFLLQLLIFIISKLSRFMSFTFFPLIKLNFSVTAVKTFKNFKPPQTARTKPCDWTYFEGKLILCH